MKKGSGRMMQQQRWHGGRLGSEEVCEEGTHFHAGSEVVCVERSSGDSSI